MPVSRTSKKGVFLADRRARAVALRKTGATMRMIAAKISEEYELEKYTEGRAFEDIDVSLKQLNQQLTHDTEEVRQLELQRYDDWLLRLAPKIQQGDEKAIRTAVQISDRRCKLLGLDAPIQVKVEEIVDAELNNFLDSIQPLIPVETFRQVLSAVSTLSDRATASSSN